MNNIDSLRNITGNSNEVHSHLFSDAGKIRASLASSRLDPNDPRNLPLLQLLRSLPGEDCGNGFTLTRMDMVRPFLTEIDFNSNPAFRHFEDKHKLVHIGNHCYEHLL